MKKIVCVLLCLLLSLSAREIVDMGGKKVEIPDVITKVFGTSPPSTYMIYTIDASLIVGLNFNHARGNNESSNMLDPRFMALPVVGGLQGGGNSMNRETLLSLHPDVVFLWNNDASSQLAQYLFESSKIPSIDVDLESVESLPKAYLFFGEVLGREQRAKILSDYATKALEHTKEIVKANASKRPVVYYAEGADGLSTECDQSFHYEAIKFAGGINPHLCTTKSGMGLEKVSLEQVILYNPDVIVAQEREFVEKVKSDARWNSIKAVREGRVYLVPKVPFNWIDRPPSFMRLLGVKWLTHILYTTPNSEQFTQEMREFYKLFLNIDLNDTQLHHILGRV
ncbi:iron chelate uptake transporter (FeCT) family transport system periplasmic binding protein [Sulfurospirillum diekertiae]|uniref:Iron chelate uptake transporter (FeCT) family transport system periplasmic binding protein n=1 Tax=Sulfurospirillum diekertiae TaxID=1854492 RepID=A0A290HSG6_9BACT|nr:ABC transporter substrate-binding protein [Sulfurospirillum diekertiae]ATB70658.1 iron chelate uptake transporter (FeCT) family transport system periplasmic binding protein [Sulfurospirillum diekertiae]